MCGQKTQLYLKKIFYCYLFWQLQWENVSEKLMTVHYSFTRDYPALQANTTTYTLHDVCARIFWPTTSHKQKY